jgi:D-glycero-D-manno-heptose 1,7-bisphosphate phosphatase
MGERRAVFLDRDGTLMEEVDYCNDPKRVRVFPGTLGALQRLRSAGWWTVVVTNQSGLAKGRISPEQYAAVNAELLRQLPGAIDAVYFAPDHPEKPTPRRKPGIGMLEEAARDHGIDLARCWMIGDKAIDVECGRNAGCRTILVRTGYGAGLEDTGADFVCEDVVAASDMILALCRG